MKNVIIAVIVTVVGGLILKAAEIKFFDSKPKSEISAAQGKSIKPDEPTQKVPEPTNTQNPNDVVPATPGLLELHLTANKMSSSYSRDQELVRLVDYAIGKGDLRYAIKIARDISSSYSQDIELNKLVKQSLALRKYDIATHAADAISSSYTKDLRLAEILKEQKEHPAPSNQVVQRSSR